MKVGIIKLGAMGDVIRTTPVLSALKQKYPDSEITWITKKESIGILEGNKNIDKLLAIPTEPEEKFDVLYNFDIESEAGQLALKIQAEEKFGYYDNEGFPASFNEEAEYYLETVFNDDLKKANRKTYQQMMFELAGLEYKKQPCEIVLTEEDKQHAKEFIEGQKLNAGKLVGIHIGSSPRWPSKAWSQEKIKEFTIQAKKQGNNVIIFAGPDEKEKASSLVNELKEQGIDIQSNNPENSFKEFASLVALCDKMICGDSLALHVSVALERSTTALFFCNTPHEIEGYGLVTKVI